MSDYIKRIRVYNEDGTSEDKQIDYNALANLPDAMPLGETEGTAYEGSKGAKNAQKIELLDKVVLQSGLYDLIGVSQEYGERVTALGANIVDGSMAKLLTVEGNTQATKNLINPALYTGADNVNFGENGIITVTNHKSTDISFSFNTGVLPAGQYTLSIEAGRRDSDDGTYSDNPKLYVYKGEASQPFLTISTYPFSRVITIEEDMKIRLYGTVAGGIGKQFIFTRLQIEAGEEKTEYAPYFDGLKNATFQGIVSKNADRTQESVLSFPEPVECGVGVTIDFENQKIINQGVEIPFTAEQKAVGNEYKVWKNGTETVIGGGYPESGLTQQYFELLGGASDETT